MAVALLSERENRKSLRLTANKNWRMKSRVVYIKRKEVGASGQETGCC